MSSDRYKTSGRARDPAGLGARWISQLDNQLYCKRRSRIAARVPSTASISRTHSQCQRGAERPTSAAKTILFSKVISFLFNSETDCSVPKVNSEDGFPHSEICGSKVAHTSPQLIAACHVLHRLCMPRHPRIALTSRLRIHTTNDKIGTQSRWSAELPSKRSPSHSGSDPKHSTQLDINVVIDTRLSRRTVTRSSVESPCRHGIDF